MKLVKKGIAFLSLSLFASSAMAISLPGAKLDLPERNKDFHGTYSLYLVKNGESNLLYSAESDEYTKECAGIFCIPNWWKEFPVNPGDSLKLVVKPDEGYKLDQARIANDEVTSDLSCSENVCSFLMSSKPLKMDLKFSKKQYSVTFTRVGENPVTTKVNYGDTPKAPGWKCPQQTLKFKYDCSWNAPFAPAKNDTTYEYQVKTTPINYTLNIFRNSNVRYRLYTLKDGVEKLVRTDDSSLLPAECRDLKNRCSLTLSGYNSYYDEPLKLIVIPQEGYLIKSVFKGQGVSENGIYDFKMPEKNLDVELVAEKKKFVITFQNAYPPYTKVTQTHEYGDKLTPPEMGCVKTPGFVKECHWDRNFAMVTDTATYKYVHGNIPEPIKVKKGNIKNGTFSLYKMYGKYALEDLKRLNNDMLELVFTGDTTEALKRCPKGVEKCALLKDSTDVLYSSSLKLVQKPQEGYAFLDSIVDELGRKIAECKGGVCSLEMPASTLILNMPYVKKEFVVTFRNAYPPYTEVTEKHKYGDKLKFPEMSCVKTPGFVKGCHWDKELAVVTDSVTYNYVHNNVPELIELNIGSVKNGKYSLYKLDGSYKLDDFEKLPKEKMELVLTSDTAEALQICKDGAAKCALLKTKAKIPFGSTLKFVQKPQEGALFTDTIFDGKNRKIGECRDGVCHLEMPLNPPTLKVLYPKKKFEITFLNEYPPYFKTTATYEYGDKLKAPKWDCVTTPGYVQSCRWDKELAVVTDSATYRYLHDNEVAIYDLNLKNLKIGKYSLYKLDKSYKMEDLKKLDNETLELVLTNDTAKAMKICKDGVEKCNLLKKNVGLEFRTFLKFVMEPQEGFDFGDSLYNEKDKKVAECDNGVCQITMPNGNLTLKEPYIIKRFTVFFKNGDQGFDKHYNYGAMPEIPSFKCPKNDSKYSYSCHWDKEIVPVTDSVVYEHLVEQSPKSYFLSMDSIAKSGAAGKYSIYVKMDNEYKLVMTNDNVLRNKACLNAKSAADSLSCQSLFRFSYEIQYNDSVKLVVDANDSMELVKVWLDKSKKKEDLKKCTEGNECEFAMVDSDATIRYTLKKKGYRIVFTNGVDTDIKWTWYNQIPEIPEFKCSEGDENIDVTCGWDKEIEPATENTIYTFEIKTVEKQKKEESSSSVIPINVAESSSSSEEPLNVESSSSEEKIAVGEDESSSGSEPEGKRGYSTEDTANVAESSSSSEEPLEVESSSSEEKIAVGEDVSSSSSEPEGKRGYSTEDTANVAESNGSSEEPLDVESSSSEEKIAVGEDESSSSSEPEGERGNTTDDMRKKLEESSSSEEPQIAESSSSEEKEPSSEGKSADSKKKESSKPSKKKSDSSSSSKKSVASDEKKKEEQPMSKQPLVAPWYTVSTIGRDVQIAGAHVGSPYIIFDMQGRVMLKGRVDNANFNLTLPQAGTYMLRIGKEAQKVMIR